MAPNKKSLSHFFREEIWRMHATERGVKRALIATLQVTLLVGKRFRDDKGFLRASALAYTTLLSLVPLLAFAFAILKGLGADKQLRDYLLSEPVAQARQSGQVVSPEIESTSASGEEGRANLLVRITGGRREAAERLFSYIDRTNATALGVFGLVMLLWTVVNVLKTVEVTFNDIWGVREGRSWMRRISDYTSAMIIAPVLLVTAGGLFAFLTQHHFGGVGAVGAAWQTAVKVVGWVWLPVLIWAAFTAFYALMPNASVGFASAVTGGIVGGTLWQLAFWGYTTFNIGVAKYNAIYTSFAALPIFLVWLYFSWVLVIVGAEAAYARAHIETYRQSLVRFNPSTDARELVAVRIFLEIANAFRGVGSAPTADDLAAKAGVPLRVARETIETLQEAGLVAQVTSDEQGCYKPGRDIARITPKDVFCAIRRHGDNVSAGDGDPLWGESRRLHSVIDDSLSRDDMEKSVSALLDSMK